MGIRRMRHMLRPDTSAKGEMSRVQCTAVQDAYDADARTDSASLIAVAMFCGGFEWHIVLRESLIVQCMHSQITLDYGFIVVVGAVWFHCGATWIEKGGQ
jgi:hypothetical protein